jgi:hypothetical protein
MTPKITRSAIILIVLAFKYLSLDLPAFYLKSFPNALGKLRLTRPRSKKTSTSYDTSLKSLE